MSLTITPGLPAAAKALIERKPAGPSPDEAAQSLAAVRQETDPSNLATAHKLDLDRVSKLLADPLGE